MQLFSLAPADQGRRSFLRRALMLSAGAVAYLLPEARSEAFLFRRKEYKVVTTRMVMGTFVTMTAFHASKDAAEDAIGSAFLLVERLGRMLSRHDPSSPLSELNRSGRLEQPDAELIQVVQRGLHWYEKTGGAFDMTVKPLIDLYETSFAVDHTPEDTEILAALAHVGSGKVKASAEAVALDEPGMGITLDGIAKGFIVDAASKLLLERGIENHLINAGGDMRASGAAAQGKPWTIAIQDPDKGDRFPQVVRMGSGAIATSGNYEIFYDSEKLFYHIVDPASGRSPVGATSATVVAPTVMDADALATGVMVLGPQRGPTLMDTLKGYACLVIDADRQLKPSSNWTPDLTSAAGTTAVIPEQ